MCLKVLYYIKHFLSPDLIVHGTICPVGIFVFERGQTHFSQLNMSLDPEKLECCTVKSLQCAGLLNYMYGM